MAAVELDHTAPEEQRALAKVDRDLLGAITKPGKTWFALMGFCSIGIVAAVAAFAHQIDVGIGVSGLRHPIFWGVYITTFVFWVGIAHAGTLISAILYLFRSGWRTSINRAAEAMTIFAVMTAGLFPLIHVGRPWAVYFLIPYPNQRMIWPNFKSPLVWDMFAISTYGTISLLFWGIGLIPDIAMARDRAKPGPLKMLYTVLSFGWTGSSKAWRHYRRAYLFLAGIATPLVLSVHSVVSWDFAMGIVPGWHATIFAPYFVAGAIFSGVGMVVTVLIPLRKILGISGYINRYHFENMARLILLTSTIVGFSYTTEIFIAWWGGEEIEISMFQSRIFGDQWWAFWTMFSCNVFIPALLWVKRIRSNLLAFWIISIFINIGMWFERFVIIVSSLSHEFIPAEWAVYKPSWVEMTIFVGSWCWFFFWFLIFIKVLPVISIAEVKERYLHQLPLLKRAKGAHHG